MVYPKIYRPLMGTRGTFFFIFKFLPFCFQFLIRFKTYAYFWAYQFFSFFFSTQKNSSNYGSPMCRGQEKSSASTMSTTFAFFPLPCRVLSLSCIPTVTCLLSPPPSPQRADQLAPTTPSTAQHSTHLTEGLVLVLVLVVSAVPSATCKRL
jgi:hypothetical protein